MTVNDGLTPKRRYVRPKRYTETADYLDMVGRMIRAAGPRVGRADMDELHQLLRLRDELDQVIDQAVQAVRENGGYSWAAIGEAAGMTRQAAQQRWGRRRRPRT